MNLDVRTCYLCGKCSAGCPVSFAMDIQPHQLIRLLQIKNYEMVLSSEAIWTCLLCGACATYCTRGINLPQIISELRLMTDSTTSPAARQNKDLHYAFLQSVEKNGRFYEFGFIARNLSSGKERIKMSGLTKGKIKLLPSRIKDRAQIKRLFRIIREKGGQNYA